MRSYFKRPLEDWSSIFFKLMTFIQWRWNEHKKLPSMFCTIYICGRIFFIFLHFQKWLLKFYLSIWCLLYCLSLYMTKNIEDMYCLLQVYRLGGGCSWWPTCIFPTVNINPSRCICTWFFLVLNKFRLKKSYNPTLIDENC